MESESIHAMRGESEGKAIAVYFGESTFWGVGDHLQEGRFDPSVINLNISLLFFGSLTTFTDQKPRHTRRELPV